MAREFTIYKVRKERNVSFFPFEKIFKYTDEVYIFYTRHPDSLYGDKIKEIRRGSVDDYVEIKLEDFDEEFIQVIESDEDGKEIRKILASIDFTKYKLICDIG